MNEQEAVLGALEPTGDEWPDVSKEVSEAQRLQARRLQDILGEYGEGGEPGETSTADTDVVCGSDSESDQSSSGSENETKLDLGGPGNRVFASYGSGLLEQEPPGGRCLVLSGDTSFSLFHHLGVVLHYIESGVLSTVTRIWAEGPAVALAVLLKVHWSILSADQIKAEKLHDMLVTPVLDIARRGTTHDKIQRALKRRFNLRRKGSDTHLDWADLHAGPSLHLCVKVRHSDPFKARSQKLPMMVYCREEDLADFAVFDAVGVMFNQAENIKDNPVAASGSFTGRGTYRTLFSALIYNIAEVAESHEIVVISHGGRAQIPPLGSGTAICGDMSEVHNPHEFSSAVWNISRKMPQIRPSVLLYSVFDGDYQHIHDAQKLDDRQDPQLKSQVPTQFKQQLAQFFRTDYHGKVTDSSLMEEMVNWGYTVAWSINQWAFRKHIFEVDPGVMRDTMIKLPPEFYQKSKTMYAPTGERKQGTDAFHAQHRRVESMYQEQGRLAYCADTVSISSSSASLGGDDLVEPKHTPCKALKNWWKRMRAK